MNISTIVIIVLLILALYYYTSENFEVIQTVGKHIFVVVKDAAVVRSLDEYQDEITEDIKGIPKTIENIFENLFNSIKKRFEEYT